MLNKNNINLLIKCAQRNLNKKNIFRLVVALTLQYFCPFRCRIFRTPFQVPYSYCHRFPWASPSLLVTVTAPSVTFTSHTFTVPLVFHCRYSWLSLFTFCVTLAIYTVIVSSVRHPYSSCCHRILCVSPSLFILSSYPLCVTITVPAVIVSSVCHHLCSYYHRILCVSPSLFLLSSYPLCVTITVPAVIVSSVCHHLCSYCHHILCVSPSLFIMSSYPLCVTITVHYVIISSVCHHSPSLSLLSSYPLCVTLIPPPPSKMYSGKYFVLRFLPPVFMIITSREQNMLKFLKLIHFLCSNPFKKISLEK